MSRDVATGSSRSSLDELPTRSTTNTQTFLETCVLDADHQALKEHLLSNPVQQSDLDSCLLRGLRMVQRKKKELSDMTPALTILLQSGAKWHSDVFLGNKMTPYHIICQSRGDHHKLLDLMIKSSERTIINTRDSDKRTALIYAVNHANIKCLKCLIAHGADVNIGDDYCFATVYRTVPNSPILDAMRLLCNGCSEHPFSIIAEIFDLLLDTKVDVNESFVFSTSISYQSKPLVSDGKVYCTKQLINKGVRLDVIDGGQCYVWSKVAMMGNIELLKFMFNRGIDKDAANMNGLSILGHVVYNGNIEAVRYLLDLGVVIPSVTPEVRKTQCKGCKENTLIIEDCDTCIHTHHQQLDSFSKDPCMIAIRYNMLEIVKMLEEYGSQSCSGARRETGCVKTHSSHQSLF